MATNEENFKSEYKTFIIDYLLGLLGIDKNSIKNKIKENSLPFRNEMQYFYKKDKYIYFNTSKETLFSIELDVAIDSDDEALMKRIIPKFFKIAKYKENGSKNCNYISNVHKEINYNFAIQSGICEWLSGNKSNNELIEKLLDVLDTWSSKTYEGKNVSYGLVFDSKLEHKESDIPANDFLKFLNDEFSAVLTDSITSVFIINKDCELANYETIFDSIDSNNQVEWTQLINNLPLRFADVISKTVNTNSRIGVFLLVNGDIILCKNQKIRFVKRIGKWLNFNISSFKNILLNYDEFKQCSPKLIDEIYSSALDVSFSHSGGIIAVDFNIEKIVDNFDERNKIVNRCDYICNNSEEDSDLKIKEYLKNKNNDLPPDNRLSDKVLETDIEKKLLKRKVIKKLVNNKSFITMNRKLRSELISLDGACILDKDGNICAFGAIIQNDSGSSGGGRGEAAKKLSNNGFAIKISTDGYIELYCKQEKVFVIK